jgi:hypothetical protein
LAESAAHSDDGYARSNAISVYAHPKIKIVVLDTRVSFRSRNEAFFARSRKSKDCPEAYIWYVAQAIAQIDSEIAEKDHFMDGNYLVFDALTPICYTEACQKEALLSGALPGG